jgi:hypothetical protein
MERMVSFSLLSVYVRWKVVVEIILITIFLPRIIGYALGKYLTCRLQTPGGAFR